MADPVIEDFKAEGAAFLTGVDTDITALQADAVELNKSLDFSINLGWAHAAELATFKGAAVKLAKAFDALDQKVYQEAKKFGVTLPPAAPGIPEIPVKP
jgi:hypothetical protein